MTKAHTEQTEALQKAGAIALRLSRSGDKQAAASIRALLARVQGLEASQARVPLSYELPQGFLSDVLTAAGLVSHGKQCKALGSRLGESVEAIWKISIQQREVVSIHGITQEQG